SHLVCRANPLGNDGKRARLSYTQSLMATTRLAIAAAAAPIPLLLCLGPLLSFEQRSRRVDFIVFLETPWANRSF
ncbi:MAG: hypothetical protein ABIQ16_05940, partial [Polyangiaceae bacterium]